MSERSDRLVEAASRVIHERGAAATTLALVATEASVPLGNVYYYFKTKDDLVDAVVDARRTQLRAFLSAASEQGSPVDRLCMVVDRFKAGADDIVRLGCPYGSLASELEKEEGRTQASDLFAIQLDWMEKQFRALDVAAPRARAVELLCAIQGACLVAHALHDAGLFKTRLTALARQLRNDLAA